MMVFIVAMVVLFGVLIVWDGAGQFLRDNVLVQAQRIPLMVAMGVTAVVTVGAFTTIVLKRRSVDGVEIINRASRWMLPMVLLPLLPAFWYRTYRNSLTLSIYLTAFVLLLEWTTRVSANAWWPFDSVAGAWRRWTQSNGLAGWIERRGPLAAVLGAVAIYVVWASVWTIAAHHKFQTEGYDLGQYDNLFWNTLHGDWLRCYPLDLTENWHGLRNHADLAVFWLLPFYAIAPRAETLLVIQSVIIGSGAIAIYLFGANRLSKPTAMIFALAYLLYAPTVTSNFYDFHMQPIAGVLILYVIYFADVRKTVPFWIAFALALSCREDIPIGLAVLGMLLWFSGARPRLGRNMTILALAYFVLMRGFIMDLFGPWWFANIYQGLYPEDQRNFGGVIHTLVTNPAYVAGTLIDPSKLRYTLQIFGPLAFLPLRRPYLWFLLVPGFLLTLLTTQYRATISIAFQYNFHWIPYIFPAAIWVTAQYGKTNLPAQRAAVTAVLFGAILSSVCFGPLSTKGSLRAGFFDINFERPTESHQLRRSALHELISIVEPDESVAVSGRELPHVSNRKYVYTLKDGLFGADYLLYSTDNMTKWGYLGSERAIEELKKGTYLPVAAEEGLVLLKRRDLP